MTVFPCSDNSKNAIGDKPFSNMPQNGVQKAVNRELKGHLLARDLRQIGKTLTINAVQNKVKRYEND